MLLRYFLSHEFFYFYAFSFPSSALWHNIVPKRRKRAWNVRQKKFVIFLFLKEWNFWIKKFSGLEKLQPWSPFFMKRDRNENKLEQKRTQTDIYCNLQFVKHFITSNGFYDELREVVSDQLCNEIVNERIRVLIEEKCSIDICQD